MTNTKGGPNGPYDAGPGGTCECPDCDYEVAHKTGTPCKSRECPDCGATLQRKEAGGNLHPIMRG